MLEDWKSTPTVGESWLVLIGRGRGLMMISPSLATCLGHPSREFLLHLWHEWAIATVVAWVMPAGGRSAIRGLWLPWVNDVECWADLDTLSHWALQTARVLIISKWYLSLIEQLLTTATQVWCWAKASSFSTTVDPHIAWFLTGVASCALEHHHADQVFSLSCHGGLTLLTFFVMLFWATAFEIPI
jgi:hypothetical protein